MLDEESKEFLESFKSFNRIYFLVTDAADSFPFIINSKNRTKNLLSGLKKTVVDFERILNNHDLV